MLKWLGNKKGLITILTSLLVPVFGFITVASLFILSPTLVINTSLHWFSTNQSPSAIRTLVLGIQNLSGQDFKEDIGKALMYFEDNYIELNHKEFFTLTNIEVLEFEESLEEEILPIKDVLDSEFPAEESYTLVEGVPKTTELISLAISIGGENQPKTEFRNRLLHPGIQEVVATGEKDPESIQEEIEEASTSLIEAIKSEDEVSLTDLFAEGESWLQIKEVSDFDFKTKGISSWEFNLEVDDLQLGILSIHQRNCLGQAQIFVEYDHVTQTFKFSEIKDAFGALCNNTENSDGTIDLVCQDCWLAPVNKKYKLSAAYVPVGLESVGVAGGGTMTKDAAKAMREMFQNASSKEVYMNLVSTYRSYDTQVGTFAYWVSIEMGRGYSRAEAESRANEYSAKPGHSEHQLGTTADLSCSNCDAFGDTPGNRKVYEYLKGNAHKFGFVISYPEGKDDLTGYNYEPWHVRYVGKTHAKKLFELEYLNSENDLWPVKYLEELGEY